MCGISPSGRRDAHRMSLSVAGGVRAGIPRPVPRLRRDDEELADQPPRLGASLGLSDGRRVTATVIRAAPGGSQSQDSPAERPDEVVGQA